MLHCVLCLLLFHRLFQVLSSVNTRMSRVVFLLPPCSDYFHFNCLFFIPELIIILLVIVSTDGPWDLRVSDGQGCCAYTERLIFSFLSNYFFFFINHLLYWIILVRDFSSHLYCCNSNWSLILLQVFSVKNLIVELLVLLKDLLDAYLC